MIRRSICGHAAHALAREEVVALGRLGGAALLVHHDAQAALAALLARGVRAHVRSRRRRWGCAFRGDAGTGVVNTICNDTVMLAPRFSAGMKVCALTVSRAQGRRDESGATGLWSAPCSLRPTARVWALP